MRPSMQDRIAGLIALAAGGVSLWEAYKLYPFHTSLWIGDHAFPGLIGIGLLVAGALLLLKPAGSQAEERQSQHESEKLKLAAVPRPTGAPEERQSLPGSTRLKLAAVPAILLGYALALPWSGYLLGTLVGAVLLFRTFGGYRWRVCLFMAALATAGMELVFVEWLNTPLPAGKIIWLKEAMKL